MQTYKPRRPGTRGERTVRAEPDTYLAIISSASFGYAQRSGIAMLTLDWRLLSGDQTGPRHAGKVIRDRLALTEPARWRMDLLAEAIGISPDDEVTMDDPASLERHFLERTAYITVGWHREYLDVVDPFYATARVDPPDAQAQAEQGPDPARAGGAPAPQAAPGEDPFGGEPPPPVDPNSDDIPF